MIARTHSRAFYGLPPKALRSTQLQITHPEVSTRISGSISTISAQSNGHNHAGHTNDIGDVGSDASFGEAIPVDMNSTTRHQPIQSTLTDSELLGFRRREQISSFSKAQGHHPLNPGVGALPENLSFTERQLWMSAPEAEARHRSFDWFTEVLREKDNSIQDAKMTIDQLEIRDQDANGSIENLRIKIQQLRDENLKLVTDRGRAQDDVSTALCLAHNAVVRYNHSPISGKREWAQLEYTCSSPERSTKNPRHANVSVAGARGKRNNVTGTVVETM